MSTLVYRIHALLSLVLARVPVGTNLRDTRCLMYRQLKRETSTLFPETILVQSFQGHIARTTTNRQQNVNSFLGG